MARMRPSPALLGFALLPLLLAPGVLGGGVIWQRDVWAYHWPIREVVAAQLAAGRLPLWTASVGCGVPLLDNPAVGALYPFNVLACALPSGLGLTAMLLVHLVIAGLGARALARAYGADAWGAAVAGVAYAASGPVLSTLVTVTHTCAAAWIPLGLLGARRLALGDGPRWGLMAAAALALQVLGGAAQMAAYTTAAMAAALWLDRPADRVGAWPRGLGQLGAIAAGGVWLAAVQILPATEWVGQVARAPFALKTATQGAWRPDELLAGLLAPGAQGIPTRASLGPAVGLAHHYLGQVWCGALPLLAACLGGPGRRGGRAPLVWALAGGLLALGVWGGLYRLLWWLVPGFDHFRFPGKALPFVAVGIAVLAGRGVTRARADAGSPVHLGVWPALVIAWVGLAALGVWWRAPVPGADPAVVEQLAAARWAALATGGGACVAAAAALGWLASRRRPGPPGLAPVVVLALTVAELTLANGPLTAVAPRAALVAPSDRLAVFGPAAGVRLLPVLQTETPARRRELQCDVAGFNAEYRALGRAYAPLLEGRATLEAYETSRLRGYVAMLEGAGPVPRWYGALGVRDLISELPLADPALVPIGGDGRTWFAYRNGLALPRARLVGAVELVADVATARRRCLDPDFPHAERAVLFAAEGPAPDCSPAAAAGGSARLIEDRGAEVSVATDAPGPTLLVLADLAYPGWHAAVDGVAAPLRTANGAFRAVAVPAGSHQVVLRRTAPRAVVGLIVSLLALAGAVVWCLRSRRGRDGGAHADRAV